MAEDAKPSLLDELAADQDPRRLKVCRWEAAIATLEDGDQFRSAMRDERFTVSSIARALERRNVQVARNTLERHRRGQCTLCR